MRVLPELLDEARRKFPNPSIDGRPTFDDFEDSVLYAAIEVLGRDFESCEDGEGGAGWRSTDSDFFRVVEFYAELVDDVVEIYGFDADWY